MKKLIFLLSILLIIPLTFGAVITFTGQIPTNATSYTPEQTIELGINVSDDQTNLTTPVYVIVTYPNSTQRTITLANTSFANKFNTSFAIPSVLNTSNLGLTFGTYTIRYFANNTLNNLTNTSVIFTVENNITLTQNTPSDSNFSNVTSHTFNCSAVGSVQLVNMTVTIYNNTGLYNTTTNWINGTSNSTAWTISLAQGAYNWTCTATTQVNATTSSNRTFTLDQTGPSIGLNLNQATKNTLRIDISINETGGGSISGQCTTNRSAATVSGSGSSQTIQELGLACGGSYSYLVTCRDSAGNAGTKTQSFSTSSCATDDSSGGGSSGGTTTTDWDSTFNLGKLEGSQTKTLKQNERVKTEINDETHYVGIEDIDSSSISLLVESTPQKATLKIGDTQTFELNNDTYYDLNVTLNSLNNTDANLTITLVHEVMPAPEEIIETTAEPTTPSSADIPTPQPIVLPQEKSSIGWAIAGVIILLGVIGGFFYYIRKMK